MRDDSIDTPEIPDVRDGSDARAVVCQRPHEPAHPVVSLDKTSKQLVAETRQRIPARPGHPERPTAQDTELCDARGAIPETTRRIGRRAKVAAGGVFVPELESAAIIHVDERHTKLQDDRVSLRRLPLQLSIPVHLSIAPINSPGKLIGHAIMSKSQNPKCIAHDLRNDQVSRRSNPVGSWDGCLTVPDMVMDSAVDQRHTVMPRSLGQIDNRPDQQQRVTISGRLAELIFTPYADFIRLPRRGVGKQNAEHAYSAARRRRPARLTIWARTASGVVTSVYRPAAMSASPCSANFRR